jgi:hypothetical protein
VVEVVGDIEGVGAIHSEPVRRAQQSRGGRAAVTVEVRDARAGDRADLPVSRDLPDPVVCVVGDVDIADAVHRHPIRKVQPSRNSRLIVPFAPFDSGPCHRTDPRGKGPVICGCRVGSAHRHSFTVVH